MNTILSINSSLFGQAGQSSQLSQSFVEKTVEFTAGRNRDLTGLCQ